MLDYISVVLACRETIQTHRRLAEEFKAHAEQARGQLLKSKETLRRSKLLPGMRYVDCRDSAPGRRRAAA